jgi:hypothetical protein
MTDPTDQRQRHARLVLSCWPRLLSVRLLALYLSLGEQTVRNRRSEIPGLVRMGRYLRWDREIVDRWVAGAGGETDLFGDRTLDSPLLIR